MIQVKQSSHFYEIGDQEGASHVGIPRYEATWRDAKKAGLLASVTTVDKVLANIGLEIWKQNQVLLAALTLPEIPGESIESRKQRIIVDAAEHGKNAAEGGEIFHNLVELGVKGEQPPDRADLTKYPCWMAEGYKKVFNYFYENKILMDYIERSFVCVDFGYGCRVDLVGKYEGVNTIFDIKTQNTKPGERFTPYPSWCRQLAANALCLPIHCNRFINIIVSTTEPGRMEIKEWDDNDIKIGWKIFRNALDIYHLGYKVEWDAEKRTYRSLK